MLKFLLIATLIILFVPPVRRFIFYLLVGRQLAKEQRQQHNPNAGRPFAGRKEGDVKVENRPPQGNTTPFKGGEYVDYEEVK